MKRKRSDEATTISRDNPLLKLQLHSFPSRRNDEQERELRSRVLAFSRVSQRKTTNPEDAAELNECVSFLLDYLESNDEVDDDSSPSTTALLFSPSNVATMLLPWAVKNLLYVYNAAKPTAARTTIIPDSSISLYWKTLRCSLSVLLLPSSAKDNVASSSDNASTSIPLSQGTLHKLMPICVQSAFAEMRTTTTTKMIDEQSNNAAICFILLANHLYRPTMDLACHSLLPMLDEHVARITTTTTTTTFWLPTRQHVQMLISMVKLLKRQRGTSNPKKVFQILAEPKIFAILARWRLVVVEQHHCSNKDEVDIETAVRELLCESFFDPVHHGEGFRGMNITIPVVAESSGNDNAVAHKEKEETTRNFRCYQETLLETISILIADPPAEVEPLSTSDAVAAALLVPNLMSGLIQMFASWERDSAAKVRKKGGRNSTPIQFRLWCHLVAPLVVVLRNMSSSIGDKRLKTERSVVVLRSIRETLSLALQHNLYLPSHKDENNMEFSFLETVATSFLDFLENANDRRESARLSEARCECLGGLEILLRLNHLVLHERLYRLVIVLGCVMPTTDPEGVDAVNVRRISLFMAVIKSYHRLRQLDYLLTALLKASDTLRNDNFALTSLKELHLGDAVRKELSVAVSRCPSNQVKDLFGILNQWVKERMDDLSGSYVSSTAVDVDFAVSLFIVVIQNVRVDKHTSADIVKLCEETIEKSACRLLTSRSGDSSCDQVFKREALMLTGWIVDLRNRSAFWNDEAGNKSGQDIVASILQDSGVDEMFADTGVIAEPVERDKEASMFNEIQFLLLHRIRELHTAIYEEHRAKMADRTEDPTKSYLEREARRLVDAVISIAQIDRDNVTRWKLLSETVLYWAPYSEPRHADAFLSWIFDEISTSGTMEEESQSEERSTYSGRVVVEALLKDASFFEIVELSSRFHPVGLVCAFDILKCAANDGNVLKEVESVPAFSGLGLASLSNDYSLRQLGKAMSAVASTNTEHFLRGGFIGPRPLLKATWILQLLNGAPPSRAPPIHGLLIRMDILCCILCLRSDMQCVETAILPLLCAARTYLASSIAPRSSIVLDEGFPLMTEGFVQSTTAVIKHISSLDMTTQGTLLRASEKVIASLAGACFSVFQQQSEPLTKFIKCFRDFLDDALDMGDAERRILLTFSRSIVKRLVVYFQRSAIEKDVDSLSGILPPFLSSLAKTFGMTDAFHSKNEYTQAETLLLNGDLVRLRSLVLHAPIETLDSSVFEQASESTSPAVCRAAEYYLSCVVAMKGPTPHAVGEIVIEKCLSGPNQLLDASFCVLVHTMESSVMRALLERLLREARTSTGNRLPALRLFHFILDHVQDEGAILEVSHSAHAFFYLCLDLILPFGGTGLQSWVNECNIGAQLLVALTENKGIISIRERDLGLILAQVGCALGDGGSFRKPDVVPVDGRVYSSCFRLVSSLLQRFSKQLYACIPSVVCTMHILLKHALYGTLADQEMTRRAQMFTRLCELLLPHRDVYRKHVLVLILEYVGALRSGIHPSRNKSIQSAVYCLIDMLSKYETDQLNTMMDTTAKALFRSTYQSYQRTHMYKGQY